MTKSKKKTKKNKDAKRFERENYKTKLAINPACHQNICYGEP